MDIQFTKLTEPTAEIAECFDRWENDPSLIPFIRPNKDEDALEAREVVTVKELEQRLEHNQIFLIYLEGQLVGEDSICPRAHGLEAGGYSRCDQAASFHTDTTIQPEQGVAAG